MAISPSDITSAAFSTSTINTSLPTYSQGNLLVLNVERVGPADTGYGGNATVTSLGGYTQVYNTAGSGYSPKLTCAYKVAGASETGPIVEFSEQCAGGWSIASLAGVDTTNPVDVIAAAQSTGYGTNIAMDSVTTTVNDAFVLGHAAAGNNNNAFGTSSWTEWRDLGGSQYNAGVAGYKFQATAGATGSATWTSSATNNWASMVVAFRPQTGGVVNATLSNWTATTNCSIAGTGPSSDPSSTNIANAILTDDSLDATFWVDAALSLASVPQTLTLTIAGGPIAAYPVGVSGSMSARLYKSDQVTPLSDEATFTSWSSSTPENTQYTLGLGNPDQAATLGDYSTAKLRFTWDQV